MNEWLITAASDPRFLLRLAVIIGTIAAAITVGTSLLGSNELQKRMKTVALEREALRGRAREQFSGRPKNANLRQAPKPFMKQVVDSLSLSQWLSGDNPRMLLMRAGFRGPQAEITFLFFRLITPPSFAAAATFYIFVARLVDVTTMVGVSIVIFALYLGLKAPEYFLVNTAQKRQESISRAFPDALDLLLICVESGVSIESAMQRVGQEIGQQSIQLAEEMTLTMAELSYLPERQQAYTNFAERTNLDTVRQVAMVLVQAERVGTPLGSALRVVSQEARTRRLLEAEKKAASLPPKLTVPMMIFFLPCIFGVLLTPALIGVMAASK